MASFSLSVCPWVFTWFSDKHTSHTGLRIHPNPVRPHQLSLQRRDVKWHHVHRGWGIWTPTYLFCGDTIPPTTELVLLKNLSLAHRPMPCETNSRLTKGLWEWWGERESQSQSEVAQSCLTLCNPVDCSLPGSSVYGIFQARVLEWAAVSFSRDKLGVWN